MYISCPIQRVYPTECYRLTIQFKGHGEINSCIFHCSLKDDKLLVYQFFFSGNKIVEVLKASWYNSPKFTTEIVSIFWGTWIKTLKVKYVKYTSLHCNTISQYRYSCILGWAFLPLETRIWYRLNQWILSKISQLEGPIINNKVMAWKRICFKIALWPWQ